MPKRTDIKSILIIGAGPIIIGQACEFDYSGTQACKALKAEGYRIILVNSNPATIMTDPDLADATYVEPITPEIVAKIIEKERPDALLPTMGGQTALNCALSLNKKSIVQPDGSKISVLEKFNVEMIGATAEAIDKAEDRELFRDAMTKIGLDTPRSHAASRRSARRSRRSEDIGLPAIIRPSFTMGGTGGGIAYNKGEFIDIVERGLDASPTSEVLIEEACLAGRNTRWRSSAIRRTTASSSARSRTSIRWASIPVIRSPSRPALTLTDKEYQIMRDASIAVLREIGVETGGSNVQFAINPADRPHDRDRDEPARLALVGAGVEGHRLPDRQGRGQASPSATRSTRLENDITGGATPASFEPTIDYVVTKIPRFAFEKFPGAEPTLTTAMKSVGEAMAIGRTFQESLQKALRSLETGLDGLDEIEIEGFGEGDDNERH